MASRQDRAFVRQVIPSDLERIVAIHLESFPGFFLTFLGRDFLLLLYKGLQDDPEGVVLVAANGEQVEGFVAGVLRQAGFYNRLLSNNKWAFARAAARALAKRPSIAPRLVRALKKPAEVRQSSCEACLMSIAVHPEFASKGIGQQLVEAFCEELSRRGANEVCLTTDQVKNEPVNRFYQRLGFQLSSTFITHEGRAMNEYLKVLSRKGA